MQSKSSKNRNGRAANQAEKNFQSWIKCRPCCWCGNESGSIVDHVVGSKYGHNKVHIGHRFVLPNCAVCDDQKTRLGQKLGNYTEKWRHEIMDYFYETGNETPIDIVESIMHWGTTWNNG